MPPIPGEIEEMIKAAVSFFEDSHEVLDGEINALLGYLQTSGELKKQVHSFRSRIKTKDGLRKKLERQYRRSVIDGGAFLVDKTNLFEKVNDLVGIRILHLHTKQFEKIRSCLQDIFSLQRYDVLEGPKARTWDDEYRAFFESLGVKTIANKRLYTSVHYVIRSRSRARVTAEIQVRTLMEEVWGEVDHLLNYPEETTFLPLREQILALARSTSASTRMVDAIFSSEEYFRNLK